MTPLFLALALLPADAPQPKRELLWPRGAPGALGDGPRDRPALTAHLPDPKKAVGTAVVVCPGGGYGGLALDHEGKQIAAWLVERGVAAFVLEYRLGPRYRHPAPLHDVQRALRTVRSRAKELGIDPKRVGVWGFSAGGHLASTAATRFDAGKPGDADPVERLSSRPDFAILCYPVITLKDPHTHKGSRRNLLGEKPDAKLVDALSSETQVTAKTPPTFLFHTRDDRAVPVENSVLFHDACKKHEVPVEMHLYPKGPHGVGLAQKFPDLKGWPGKLEAWLKGRGLLGPPAR